jgi:hypothetical protein
MEEWRRHTSPEEWVRMAVASVAIKAGPAGLSDPGVVVSLALQDAIPPA